MRRAANGDPFAFRDREMRLAVAMQRGIATALEGEGDRRGVGDCDRPVREGMRGDRHEREGGHLRIEDRAAADSAYAVDPVGVVTMIPSARIA